ncbi:MAG: molecular chaperone TorD family protein [Coriobacteriales bacterium]|jgi:TorA maturation chaperone TorD|nr:molecular chaperone TorD family protein [Coriobacteriales bacterium]
MPRERGGGLSPVAGQTQPFDDGQAQLLDHGQAQLLDAAAVTFAALGMLLYQEPDEARIGHLLEEGFFAAIPFADDEPQVAEGIALLDAWTREAASRELADVVAELGREWLRLLVGYGEPEAPPWATWYFEKDPVIFGSKTLEVRQWYARYGLELERKYHEPDDHLGLMLQFLALLISRESEAQVAGEAQTAKRYQQEQRDFLEQNILPWLPNWQARVAEKAKISFYRGLALLIGGALRTFSLRLC